MELHVAIVSCRDGIVFGAAEPTSEALLGRLAGYLEEQAPRVLWREQAEVVLSLLGKARIDEALCHYFDVVGNRWDQEFLHREVLTLPGPPCDEAGGEMEHGRNER